MNVGVTGHKGFLGNYVFDRMRSNPKAVSVEGFDLPDDELFDRDALKRFVFGKDVIIHLAALNRADDFDLLNVNLLGTFALVEAIAKENPNCRLVFSSSFGVYGPSGPDDIIDEGFPAEPSGIYGFSKRFGEEMIAYKLENHAILRISNIYGPGCRPFYNSVVATFVHLAKQGKELTVMGSGEQARDFVFVDDVVDAFEKAALSDANGVFNVCTGEAVSMKRLAGLLKKSFPEASVVHKDSDEQVIVTKGSFAKAERAFGWKPKTRFEDGLKKCWE